MKIMAIQQQVGRGEYQIDPRAVAEAIVRRILGKRAPRVTSQGHPSA